MPRIVLAELQKTFQSGRERITALTGFSLEIASGELLAVLGPSGSGKTTLLRLIGGLEMPDCGRINFDDCDVTQVPSQRREVAMVFQSHALFPHFTAFQNLEIGLKLRRVPPVERKKRVAEIAELLKIATCLDRRPAQLSGGEKQRVALGRALIRKPGVLLLDEPFAQLDAPLRRQLRRELSELHQQLTTTMILVTHDQQEAFSLGDRVSVIHGGRLQQVGSTDEIRRHPANQLVSDFVSPDD